MPPDDEGDFAAPGVNEAGPAGVQDDVLPVPRTEPDGRVVEGLAGELQDYERTRRPGDEHHQNTVGQINTPFPFRLSISSRDTQDSGLTFPVDPQHDLAVVGVEVEQDRGADQVLGEVPEERDRPENTQAQTISHQVPPYTRP